MGLSYLIRKDFSLLTALLLVLDHLKLYLTVLKITTVQRISLFSKFFDTRLHSILPRTRFYFLYFLFLGSTDISPGRKYPRITRTLSDMRCSEPSVC